MAVCSSCGQTISWVVMKSGKRMPVNPDAVFVDVSDQDKNTTIVTPDGRVVKGKAAEPPLKDAYTVGFISHFATCPKARSHRKKSHDTIRRIGEQPVLFANDVLE